MNPPDKQKPDKPFVPPCQYDIFAQSTKDEVACAAYLKMVPVETCGRDCQAYRAWKGNA
jgi:hypothetical protein